MSDGNQTRPLSPAELQAIERKAALWEKLKSRKHRVMKRCFMTGKQCKFSAHTPGEAIRPLRGENGDATGEDTQAAPSPDGGCQGPGSVPDPNVFVVMPFAPNLETFYRWSLRPYLIEGYGIDKDSVQRADEVRDIGYIICEKICRRIQQADLVMADISLGNCNVFYEIGLAFGLERPIVFMRNKDDHDKRLERLKTEALLTGKNATFDILEYPGVGKLNAQDDDHNLVKKNHVFLPPRPPQETKELRIRMLDTPPLPPTQVRGDEPDEKEKSPDRRPASTSSGSPVPRLRKRDIEISLEDILSGAVGVAMAEIRTKEDEDKGPKSGDTTWRDIVRGIDEEEWRERVSKLEPTSQVRGDQSFENVAEILERSFATVINVSKSDLLSYFWLGYCHARGLNAIPVFQESKKAPPDPNSVPGGPGGQGAPHAGGGGLVGPWSQRQPGTPESDREKLAFDIHALWFAEYDEEKPYEFKTKMREILEHLLAQDLPDREKRRFWDRFPAELPIKLFTGAMHIKEFNREMIGDWDLRTVSQLYSYLPSVRAATTIELVTPMYSPEQAYALARKNARKAGHAAPLPAAFIREYLEYIQEQLSGCSAIVIASADVNPVTECLLHRIYKVSRPRDPFGDCKKQAKPRFDGYVAVKQFDKERKQAGHQEADTDEHSFPRLFYQEIAEDQLPAVHRPTDDAGGDTNGAAKTNRAGYRGFALHASTTLNTTEYPELFKGYWDQEAGQTSFSLLGHLVVARNPHGADDPSAQGLVVLLNGVSGPATYALAQVLTGSDSQTMRTRSEEMLKVINAALDKALDKGMPDWVEGIVEVKIETREGAAQQSYLDSRRPIGWEFLPMVEATTDDTPHEEGQGQEQGKPTVRYDPLRLLERR